MFFTIGVISWLNYFIYLLHYLFIYLLQLKGWIDHTIIEDITFTEHTIIMTITRSIH